MRNLRIHPATLFVFILLILTGYSSIILPYLIAIILHELGHAFVAKKLGYRLDKIWILPFGACLSFEEFSFNPKDEIKIAFAGPLVNIFLILGTMALWWFYPITYVYSYTFALANFSIAIFNLLPSYPLDGGRILTGFLRMKYKPKKVYRIACTLNVIFSLIFLILFIFSIFLSINFSLCIISIFLFMSTIEGRFQGKYSSLLNKKLNKNRPMSVKNFCVPSSTPFYKILPEINHQKYNIIYVIYPNQKLKLVTEAQFRRILEKRSLQNNFDDLIVTKNFD
ncbi:MAG: M50 family metallopeptidase [Clostridia bacterium]|nr:M50 family metallopeptidase [Clostridia bacterium]